MTIVYAWLSGSALMLAVCRDQSRRGAALDLLAAAVLLAAAIWGAS